MKADQKIRQAKLSKWAALFQEQASSGLQVKTWCVQNGISIHAYYYWKRIAKEAYVNSIIPDIVPLPVSSPQSLPSDRITQTLSHELFKLSDLRDPDPVQHSSADTVTVSVGDIRIEFGSNTSDETIFQVIKAARHA